MSDDSRPIMRVIGTNTAGAYCEMCGQGVCSHTAAGITELIRMANDSPPERTILTDLITDLVGDDGDGHELTADGDGCAVCSAIDRAEARLREVTGDE